MSWADVKDEAEEHFGKDQSKELKRRKWWLCIPSPLSQTPLQAFKLLVRDGKPERVKVVLRAAEPVALDDTRAFAEEYHLDELQQLMQEVEREKKPRAGPSTPSSDSAHGEREGQEPLVELGESLLSKEEEATTREAIESELVEVDEPGFPPFRVNIISATPLQNTVIMFLEANIDVRWRTTSDLAQLCARLGIDFAKMPRKYGSIEAGKETAHYEPVKRHMEAQAKRIGQAAYVAIVSDKSPATLLSTAVRTKSYITYNVGYPDLVLSAVPLQSTRHAMTSAVAKELKTEVTGRNVEQVGSQVCLQYVGFCPRAAAPPLATGGDQHSPNQVVAMVTKRGALSGGGPKYVMDLYKDIPAEMCMALEIGWAAKARDFAAGDVNVFPLAIVEGYRYMKSVMVEGSRSVLTKAYRKAKELMAPELLANEDLASDAVWDGLFPE
ncbi:hypothetical protein KFL_004690020 [Klebsormidium nitens]|uniref:Uncharacterized protein n=1 Tax=Klebsormidium nitens TaxID=105231 RepID=A0A1Y1IHE6_KLENI|nr:hypothetical protein KFL_004690020 [Klebsormidium nitens]|eukprot:GAQ88909.1 hypothetical protein KFL_004690020 [Klebsormidium nitens]